MCVYSLSLSTLEKKKGKGMTLTIMISPCNLQGVIPSFNRSFLSRSPHSIVSYTTSLMLPVNEYP